jgi:acyl dehydratase
LNSKSNEVNLSKIFFEDLIEEAPLKCREVVITREAIITFAKEFDPQPFHVNETAADESIFGGLIASSLHTLSACTRVIVEAQGNVAILSGIGMDQVRMFNPVYPNDTLYVEAWWSDLKKSKSKPDRGYASIKCRVSNQKGNPIVKYGYQYLVACRDSTYQQ